jgi:CRISPR-associated protein (TIGR02710 family)
MKEKEWVERELLDANDVEKIYEQVCILLKEISRKDSTQIVCDYTSGTKAMSAALVTAAIQHKVDTLIYITGERDEYGRVIKGTERMFSLTPNKLYAEEFFQMSVGFFNNYRFEECCNLLEEAKGFFSQGDFLEKTLLLQRLSKVYSLWDKFALSKAFEELKNIESTHLGRFGIKRRVEDNKKILHKESSQKFSQERMVDLLLNAKRRGEEQKFDDAVARLYRLLEFVAQYHLKDYYKKKDGEPDTEDLDVDKLPLEIRSEYEAEKRDGKVRLALEKSFQLLKDLGCDVGNLINERVFKKLMSARNNSILAHGFSPIKRHTYEEMYEFCEKILRSLIPQFERFLKETEFPKIKI